MSSIIKPHFHDIIDGRSPSEFFLSPYSDVSPNDFFKKISPTKFNADFVWTVEWHLFEKWLTPYKAQIVLWVGNILFIKNKIKCPPAGQNLKIMTFRDLKNLVFDKFLKISQIIWCFYFWRILLVITIPLFMIIRLCLLIYTYPPIHFRENWHDHKNPEGFIRPQFFWGDNTMISSISWYADIIKEIEVWPRRDITGHLEKGNFDLCYPCFYSIFTLFLII